MKNFGNTEKIVLYISIACGIVFSYFLYDDSLLFSGGNKDGLEKIGSFEATQNDVRRKTVTDFSWMPISSKETVFLKDSIFTGASSKTTLKLTDGTVIQVAPNSLISLVRNNGELTLDLKFGDLSATIAKSGSLNLKSGDEFSQLKNDGTSNASIEINKKPGDMSFKLIDGDISVKGQNGQAGKLSQLSKLNLNNGGNALQGAPQIQTLTENDKVFLKKAPRDPVTLAWRALDGKASKYEIEVSDSPEFKNIVKKIISDTETIDISDLDQAKKYYWRVRPYDAAGLPGDISVPSAFRVTYLTPPEIQFPIDNAQLNYEIKPENLDLGQRLNLQWSTVDTPDEFQYQISTEPDFSKNFIDSKSTNLQVLSSPIPSGNYYMRIKSFRKSDGSESDWSATKNFSIKLSPLDMSLPDTPRLALKKVDFNPTPPNSRNPSQVNTPQISWTPVRDVVSYKVQISNTRDFANSTTFDVRSPQALINKYKAGSQFFRVIAVDRRGNLSEPSEIGELAVSLSEPKVADIPEITIKSEDPLSKPAPQEIELAWSLIPPATSYLVEIDKDENFGNPTRLESAVNNVKHTLTSPGTYYVRVKPLDENKAGLTGFSKRTPAVYSYVAPFPAPALKEPFNQATIFLQKEMEPFVWLEWKNTSGAKEYEVEVATDPQLKNKILATKTTQPRVLLKDRIPLGKIYWRIRTLSEVEYQNSAWSETREFTIMSQKNEAFVE